MADKDDFYPEHPELLDTQVSATLRLEFHKDKEPIPKIRHLPGAGTYLHSSTRFPPSAAACVQNPSSR